MYAKHIKDTWKSGWNEQTYLQFWLASLSMIYFKDKCKMSQFHELLGAFGFPQSVVKMTHMHIDVKIVQVKH